MAKIKNALQYIQIPSYIDEELDYKMLIYRQRTKGHNNRGDILSIVTAVRLLCGRGNGYYLQVTDNVFLILNEMLDVPIGEIKDIISDAVEIGIFDYQQYNEGFITGTDIQIAYFSCLANMRRAPRDLTCFEHLTEDTRKYFSEKRGHFSEKSNNFSEKNKDFSEKRAHFSDERKGKGTEVKGIEKNLFGAEKKLSLSFSEPTLEEKWQELLASRTWAGKSISAIQTAYDMITRYARSNPRLGIEMISYALQKESGIIYSPNEAMINACKNATETDKKCEPKYVYYKDLGDTNLRELWTKIIMIVPKELKDAASNVQLDTETETAINIRTDNGEFSEWLKKNIETFILTTDKCLSINA